MGICLLIVASTVPIAMNLGVNLVPRDDQSEFQIGFITPEGYTLDRTNKLITEIESRLLQFPGIKHRFVSIGESGSAKGQGDVTRGSIYVRISEIKDRTFTQFDIMRRVR